MRFEAEVVGERGRRPMVCILFECVTQNLPFGSSDASVVIQELMKTPNP